MTWNRFYLCVVPVALVFIVGVIKVGYGDLRFCLNGPHVMKDEDCPGGFVFKENVKPSCKFYAKTGDHQGVVLSAPVDPCDDNSVRMIEDQADDLDDIEQFTWFMWEEFAANDSMGQFEPSNICMDECLPEWVNENVAVDEEPIPDSWDPASVSDDMKETLMNMNKDMFLRIIMDEDYEKDDRKKGAKVIPEGGTPEPPTPTDGQESQPPESNIGRAEASLITITPKNSGQLNLIRLLAKSFKVAIAACSPFVKEDFFEQVLKGMMFLARSFEGNILDVGLDLYKGIAKILDHCGLKHQQDFTLNGTKCEGKEQVEGIFYPHTQIYWPYRLTGRSFRWGKYHPILDATWTVIDLIHSFCYESFMKDMMLSSVYHISMEELFPEKIQLLWRANPEVKNEKLWNNLLQTYDLNITMRNLDACSVAARNSSPFHQPLPRPFLTMEDLEKPEPGPSATAEPEKGWNKTIEKYWENYEKQGGFMKVSRKFGKCFHDRHSEEESDMLENLKSSCASTS